MTAPRSHSFPPAAGQWLVGGHGRRVLVVGSHGVPLLPVLGDHRYTIALPDAAGATKVAARHPEATVLACEAEHLPFVPACFESVVVNQTLHQFDVAAAMREFARVLVPGGQVAVSYTVRDDSVPWVRRLAALMQAVDPDAMRGDYGRDAADRLAEAPNVETVESAEFRLWAPIARVGLLQMVAGRFPDLDADRLAELLAEVGELYESSSRPTQPLALPYRVACWRVTVSHVDLTSALRPPPDGISIPL